MNILLVNDDGFYAEGLNRLKAVLVKYGNVFVVAPKVEMSGKACSVTIFNKKIDVEKIDDFNYVVDGTPLDCIIYGLEFLNLNIDLVISGCNAGQNHSYFTIYSGTIGACVEAIHQGVPAIAFSSPADHMDTIEKYTKETLDYIINNKLISKNYILSVNYPTSGISKGIRISKLANNPGETKDYYCEKGLIYSDKNKALNFIDPDSDLYHVTNGYISIAPISGNYFNYDFYDEVSRKISKTHGTKKLESDRLILRKFKMEDAETSYNNFFKDPNTFKYFPIFEHQSIEETKAFIFELNKNYEDKDFYYWAIVEKKTSEIIGFIEVFKDKLIRNQPEIGYAIGAKFQKKGYMKEAFSRVIKYFFEEEQFDYVFACYLEENNVSGKVMESCGLKYKEDEIILNRGEYVNIKKYYIYRKDYENSVKAE